MGVVIGIDLMSTATDVIYTHKKFKRPAVEVWESGEVKNNLIEKDLSKVPVASAKELEESTCSSKESFNESLRLTVEEKTSDRETDSSRNESKLSCSLCGFVNGNKSVFKQHACINLEDRKTEICRFCKQRFKLHTVCINRDCISSRESHCGKNVVTKGPNYPSEFQGGLPKVAYNRSHSYPFSSTVYFDKQDLQILSFDTSNTESNEICSTSLPAQVGKQIYKPKFRAQYSCSDEPAKEAATLHNQIKKSELLSAIRNRSSQERVSCTSTIPSTYHVQTASPLLTTSVYSEAEQLSPQSLNHIRYAPPVLDMRNAKIEDLQGLQRGISSSHSNIWKGIKGIKSPSPELVNQHITNLIVQNQAIVETHNPLWSIKYRRQSSASSLVDQDGSSSKTRRNNVSEYSKGYKGKIQSVLNFSHNQSFNHDSSSISSLPKSCYTSATSLSRASRQNISVSLPTSSNVSKGTHVDIHCQKLKVLFSDQIKSSPCESSAIIEPESLNQSSSSNSKNSNSLSCQKCGFVISCKETKEHQCKYSSDPLISLPFNYDYKYTHGSAKLSESINYVDQDVALDLQKKQDKNSLEYERSSSRESCLSEPTFKYHEEDLKTVRGLSISPNFHMQDTLVLASPPLKRRKISVNDFSTVEKPLLCAPLFPNNGKVTTKGDYGIKILEDLTKPKSNSNHIFGGEVKICDGKKYKTLKIDSNKNETPSLDLCIASKHLTEESDNKELLLPTSVVVTIAKCGLNSGGTMVKVENKGSYPNKNRTLNINDNLCMNTRTSKTSPLLSDHNLFSPAGLSISPVNIHSPLLPYSQVHSCAGTNLSPITTSNLPPGGFSLHLLPPGITLHTQSKVGSPLSLSTSIVNQSNSKEQHNFKHKDNSNQYYPAIISIGDEKVPYVPGIPGPYSQTGMVIKYPTKPLESSHLPLPSLNSSRTSPRNQLEQPVSVITNVQNFQNQYMSQSRSSLSNINNDKIENITLFTVDKKDSKKPDCANIGRIEESFVVVKPSNNIPYLLNNNNGSVGERSGVIIPQGLEIRVQPPVSDKDPFAKEIQEKNSAKKDLKQFTADDEKTFLIPRQRPSTLLIKQQSFNPKSSLALIGSTLVSPDTPRPRKSCAQLLLNGSAYTYLNLKVSTKTFFCCIYRPQPMYVSQSSNPKLSMYSNWQIRKSEDPLKLSPVDAMSLHISGHYYNRAYTIAKPKIVQLIVTPSSYWTQRNNEKEKISGKRDILEVDVPDQNLDNNSVNEKKSETHLGLENGAEESNSKSKSAKRVKIFEGGFKTNEDYIYVRGRGRGRYVCETCGIRCKKPSMLKKHIRTHTDLRPFSCKHCSFSFKTKGNLTKHLKSKAHFKRCTEMGICPVPVTVDESHINQEALQLQGNSEAEQGKDAFHCNEDGDDDDDDDGEDDDDDECDEDEDDDDEEEETNASPHHSSFSISRESVAISSCISSVKCSYPSPALPFEEDGSFHSNILLDQSEDSFENSADNSPMDLSVKRPTVITSSDCRAHEDQLIPNSLKLNKRLGDGVLKYPSNSALCIDHPSLPASHIKEQVSEILSPVTDSSMLLKSIYNSTSSLDKHHLNADPMKEGVSCGNMLHTYLKEIAVQDSARKRFQYLNSASIEYLEDAPLSSKLTSLSSGNVTPAMGISMAANLTSQNTLSISNLNNGGNSSLPVNVIAKASLVTSTSPVNVTSALALCVSTSFSNYHQPSVPVTISSTIPPTTLNNNFNKMCVSTVPDYLPSSVASKSKTGISTIKKGSLAGICSNAHISQSNAVSSTSTYIVASKTSVTNSFSSLRNNTNKILRSSSSALSSSLISSASTSMPTPPANLTVINSCEGDSKPAFIAPSGVIPSTSARMGSDDGRCKCSICQKEFAKQSQLRLHMNIHFIERPHRCDSCGVSFRTNGHLQKHKRSVSHFNKVNMNMTFGTPSTDNPRPFKCHDCKIAFRIHGHLAKHLRSKLHIMKLECLGKLPFGTYAEIERSGVNLNEIDTSDCENSLESLQAMASRLYEKDPAKLVAWRSQQLQQSQQMKAKEGRQTRGRSISNSSSNSEDYLLDEQDVSMSTKYIEEEDSGEEEDIGEISQETPTSTMLSSPGSSGGRETQSSSSPSSLPPCEVGSGATEGLLGCSQCHQKFLDVKHFEIHYKNDHEKSNEVN